VTFDGQDGTGRCAEPLDDPEAATEAAYDVWGVHSITLDRSCRVNRAPATGESDTSSAGESSTDTSTGGIEGVAAPVAEGAIVNATVAELIDGDPRLSYLSMLLKEAGLTDVMRVPGPITVFAPTDEAFDELSADTNAKLSSDPALLTELLGHHVADGLYLVSDLRATPIVLVDGHTLDVTTDGDTATVNGVPIIDPDLRAGNGVVHIVNDLLEPAELDLTGTVAP
jgi:OOP family OmpA-OmpF porin